MTETSSGLVVEIIPVRRTDIHQELRGIRDAYRPEEAADDQHAVMYHGIALGAAMLADWIEGECPVDVDYAGFRPYIDLQAELAVRVRNGDAACVRGEEAIARGVMSQREFDALVEFLDIATTKEAVR